MADRFAVITGAGSGIGRASALALMSDGWSVALAGRRKEMLEETAGMKTGGRALVVQTDVTDPAQVDNLFAQVKANFGRIDMLFNNAGGGTPTTNFGDFTYEMWRRVVSVNLDAMFLCANAAFRMMRDQSPRGGRIINNGSISAHVPRVGSVAYTASKHGVTGLTRSISLDGRQFDICAGQIDIGNAATPLTAPIGERPDAAARPDDGRAAHGREPCRPAGSVHVQPAAGIQRAVRHNHGNENAVHRPGLETPAPVIAGSEATKQARSGLCALSMTEIASSQCSSQ